MKIIYPVRFLFLILITVLSACNSGIDKKLKKRSSEYLQNDFKPDEFYPGAQVELQIKSNGMTMYGFAYTANGKGPHPTVVLLHGLPGHERSLDMAQNMRRAGYNVVYFNYRGAWGSKGVFGFQNAIEDANVVVNYLCDDNNMQTLKVDTSKIALIGHGLGGGIALLSGIKNPRVKSVIGISVFNPYTLLQGKLAPGNLVGLKEYLLSLGMLNCNPNKFLNDIINNIDRYDIETEVAQTDKPLLVIDEHMNNTYFSKYNPRASFDYKIWDTDHAFTNRRIALTKELINWLDDKVVKQAKAQ